MKKILVGMIALFSTISLAGWASASSLNNAHTQRSFNAFAGAAMSAQDGVITIIDQDGHPVPGATVVIGDEMAVSDAMGQIVLPPPELRNQPATIAAPGYVVRTYESLETAPTTLTIVKSAAQTRYEVKGQTTDFGRLVTDGKVDFGLVIPAMTRSQLLSFDLSSVISPESDVIRVIGRSVNIPSNITLPNQRETYIFPITLNKPDYRVYVRDRGDYNITAIHGQFPLQKVINDVRSGKSLFDVVNNFSFLTTGSRTVSVNRDVAGQDIAVNQINLSSSVHVVAPRLSGNQVMLALALGDHNGLLIPADVKRIASGSSMDLKTSSRLGTPYVLSAVLNDTSKTTAQNPLNPWNLLPEINIFQPVIQSSQNFNQLTFAMLPAQGTVRPQFLPLIDKPTVRNNQILMDQPQLPSGMTAIATYVVFSEIQKAGSSQIRTPIWDMFANGWTSNLTLPKIDYRKNPDRTYRWEVMFLAKPSSALDEVAQPSDNVDLNTVTYITRNAVDMD